MSMPRRSILFLVLLSAVAIGHSENVAEAPSVRLSIELSDGSHLIGVPDVASVPVETAVGKIAIPFAQVKDMTFRDASANVTVTLTNGDRLSGACMLGKLHLTCLFGTADLDAAVLRKIEFTRTSGGASPQKDLILWNRFESASDVTASRVGPGGTLSGGRFVRGRFGNAIELDGQEVLGVTFPLDIISGPDGCIEFWARLADVSPASPIRETLALVAVCDEEGTAHTMLYFNSNDGAGNGGLCARAAGLTSAGTGSYGSWTYARALGTMAVNDWHHYAFVWASNGISGFGDGTHKAAGFVDGRLNTTTWDGYPGHTLVVPMGGRFGLLYHQGGQGGRIAFDNLKIWNYAKVDFGDRNDE